MICRTRPSGTGIITKQLFKRASTSLLSFLFWLNTTNLSSFEIAGIRKILGQTKTSENKFHQELSVEPFTDLTVQQTLHLVG